MAKNDNLKDFLTDVANAIRNKKGTTALINPQDFSNEIKDFTILKSQVKRMSITSNGTVTISPDSGYNGLSSVVITTNVESSGGTGGTGTRVSKGDVTFYDYDGTILYSYSKSEFLNLSSLPNLPTREGLTCQGWNYTLANAQSYVRKSSKLDIGATYITNDGCTRLYINIAAEGRMEVPLYINQTVSGGVVIDWGDGSDTETFSGTGNVSGTHNYANTGDYIISLRVTNGELKLGHNTDNNCVLGTMSVYVNMLQKVEIGSGVTKISDYAFDNCHSLAYVVIPNSVTSIGRSAFYGRVPLASIVIPNSVTRIGIQAFDNCYFISSIVIPNSVTSIGTQAFDSCESLASIVIPNSVTRIETETISNCSSLAYVVIPNSVTYIGDYAFKNCSCVAMYDFMSHTKVPTLYGVGAFSGIPSDCEIRVPAELADSWKNAQVWTNYADNIVGY